MMQHDLVFFGHKETRLGPPQIMHLIHERSLTEDSTDQLNGEWPAIVVCAKNLSHPDHL